MREILHRGAAMNKMRHKYDEREKKFNLKSQNLKSVARLRNAKLSIQKLVYEKLAVPLTVRLSS